MVTDSPDPAVRTIAPTDLEVVTSMIEEIEDLFDSLWDWPDAVSIAALKHLAKHAKHLAKVKRFNANSYEQEDLPRFRELVQTVSAGVYDTRQLARQAKREAAMRQLDAELDAEWDEEKGDWKGGQ